MDKEQPVPKGETEETKEELRRKIRKEAWQLRGAENFEDLPLEDQKLIEGLLVEGE